LRGRGPRLQRIHAALRAGAVLIDTQPVSPGPAVEASRQPLGRLDMREWLRTIESIDALVAQSVDAGLYSVEHEHRFSVADSWDSGLECAGTIAGWQGTRLPGGLAERVAAAPPPLTVDQEVRLRIL